MRKENKKKMKRGKKIDGRKSEKIRMKNWMKRKRPTREDKWKSRKTAMRSEIWDRERKGAYQRKGNSRR